MCGGGVAYNQVVSKARTHQHERRHTMAKKTYYAGNGREIVGFDTAADRDEFTARHPRFCEETAGSYYYGYRDYPQWKCARDMHGVLFDDARNRVAIVDDDFELCYLV